MAKEKVLDEDLKRLADVYNSTDRKTVYEMLHSEYDIKNPYFVFRRMCNHPELAYNKDNDSFEIIEEAASDVFMSMDELCSPIVQKHVISKESFDIDSRPAAMDKLIHELIGDRLLELSKYITIDSISKKIIVDKTTLSMDGYQLIMH